MSDTMVATTSQQSELLKGMPVRLLSSQEVPNLYQRLAAIAGEVGQIKATGKTAQNQSTLSIVDVENALRGLFAKHRVVTGFRWNNLPVVVEARANSSVYQADLTVWLVNADRPDDLREDRVIDFATSPSGAVSFALKRYYRALFHLADESDETRDARETASRTSSSPKSPRRSVPGTPPPSGAGASSLPVQESAIPSPEDAPVPEKSEDRAHAIARVNTARMKAGLDAMAVNKIVHEETGKSSLADCNTWETVKVANAIEAFLKEATKAAGA